MRCKKCDYRLWNITSRRCPECGEPFLPSDYEFVPNSIRYCCPHCNQSYYGTGPKGHLWPPEFDCVSCGKHIHMDEMSLFPTAGVQEEQTRVFCVPWLERKERGRIKSWFSTIGMALVSPIRLMQGLPLTSPAHEAFRFAFINTFLFMIIAFVPLMIFPAVMMIGMGRGAGSAGIAGVLLVPLLSGLLIVTVLLGLWSLVAHGILLLTGKTIGGLKRTFQAICYSSGANVITAIPCMGFYFGWIWWLISAVLMVKEGQRVHGGRAALAVLTLPVLLVVGVVGSYAWLFLFFLPAKMATAVPTTQSAVSQSLMSETQIVLQGILQYSYQHSNRGPGHGVQLVTEHYITQSALVGSVTSTSQRDVPIGDITLNRLGKLPHTKVDKVVKAAIDALPKEVVAHRVGDYVFTYHGMNLRNADPDLWVVITSKNPGGASSSPSVPIVSTVVGNAYGTISEIMNGDFPAKLAEQNALRAKYGLPPLPDPATVTHTQPAAGGP